MAKPEFKIPSIAPGPSSFEKPAEDIRISDQYRVTARLTPPTVLLVGFLAYRNRAYADLTLMVGVIIVLGNVALAIFGNKLKGSTVVAARIVHNLGWSLALVAVCGDRAPGWLIGLPSISAFGTMGKTRANNTGAWLFMASIVGLSYYLGGVQIALMGAVCLGTWWLIGRNLFITAEAIASRDMYETRRQLRVFTALQYSASTITEGLTVQEIYVATSQALRKCGFNLTVLRVQAGRMSIEHLGFPEKLVKRVESLVSIRRADFSATIDAHPFFKELAANKQALFQSDAGDITAALAKVSLKVGRGVMQILGWTHLYGAPLHHNGTLRSFLVISGNGLTDRDRALVDIFAAQFEAAIAQADLLADLAARTNALQVALATAQHQRAEKRKANAAAERASRLASLGTLAAGIAHEINNPLTFVMGNLQFVSELPATSGQWDEATEADFKETMEDIQLGTMRIRDIVQSVKLFSRVSESPESVPIDLAQVVNASMTLAGAELKRRARVEFEVTKGIMVLGNESRLGQVCVNLLVNAAQAITPGKLSENLVRVTVSRDDEASKAILEVSDTGCGISVEDQERIFEPFYSTKQTGDGTGLGLAIISGIVTEMAGIIEVSSSPERGTTFRIVFDLAHEPMAASDQPVPSASQGLPRLLILSPHQSDAKKVQSSWDDVSVDYASSQVSALRMLETSRYAALLCDVRSLREGATEFYETMRLGGSSRWIPRFGLLFSPSKNSTPMPLQVRQLTERYPSIPTLSRDRLSNPPSQLIENLLGKEAGEPRQPLKSWTKRHRFLTPGGSSLGPAHARMRKNRIPTPPG